MGHVRVTVGSCINRSNIWVMLGSLWGHVYIGQIYGSC